MKTKERVAPFAMHFQEKIPEEGIAQVGGRYNPETQTWEWPNQTTNPSIEASFPSAERPPTTCTVPTRISPTVTRADRGVDD